MREIASVITLQESLAWTFSSTAKPSNDMVQHFAELLDRLRSHAQRLRLSYGSALHAPVDPVGHVRAPRLATVGWTTYAQSPTDKPRQGHAFHRPVTIIARFRNDLPYWRDCRPDRSGPCARGVRPEAAGIAAIQVAQMNLPAFALDADRHADSLELVREIHPPVPVRPDTQIHHAPVLPEFGQMPPAGLDADVTSIEAAFQDGGRPEPPRLARPRHWSRRGSMPLRSQHRGTRHLAAHENESKTAVPSCHGRR